MARYDAPMAESVNSDGRGRFIVLDGVDGCGKSTQARRLIEALGRDGGPEPLHLREPGSSVVGERIRAVLLDGALEIEPGTETLLFAAARRQTLADLVAPALAAGRHVVCERFHPSTFAYQAVAGELEEERVLGLLEEWAGDPAPDLVILIDTPPRTAAGRLDATADRIEAKGLEFQERVAQGYRRYAERVPETIVVDGTVGIDEVAAQILGEVQRAWA